MRIPTSLPRLKGFRFPREIISYAVWAYHRFALSTADVEDLLAERGVITDKLRSYIKPIKALAPNADHRAHKGLNNALEGSHRPTRKREKILGRFKSHRQAQRFLYAPDPINLIFRPRRYRLTATSYRHARADTFSLWADYTADMAA